MDTTTGGKSGEDLRRSAESTVSTIAEQAQQTADAHLSSQKETAATALHSVAEAVRNSSGRLREEQPQLASLAEQAAQKVDRASDYIRQHDVRDFVREAEGFARREPLIFLGGAFALGFLAARFLKASSPSGDGRGMSARRDWNAGDTYRTTGRGAGGTNDYDAWEEPPRERSVGGPSTRLPVEAVGSSTSSGRPTGGIARPTEE